MRRSDYNKKIESSELIICSNKGRQVRWDTIILDR
jgi:hypothetical protein